MPRRPELAVLLAVMATIASLPVLSSQEVIRLEYAVETSSPVGVLVTGAFTYSECGSNWSTGYNVTETSGSRIYSMRLAVLVLPERFNATVILGEMVNGGVPINVTLHLPGARLYGVRLELEPVNPENMSAGLKIVNETVEPLCTRDLTISYTKRLLAGLIPVGSYKGVEGVDSVTLFYARPRALGEYAATLYSQGINAHCVLKIGGPGGSTTLDYRVALLAPPPGDAYECCGLRFEQAQTMAPADRLPADKGELLKAVADLVSNETGIAFREKAITFQGLKLVSYISDPITQGENTVRARLQSVDAGLTDPYMLYHAAHGFLVEWRASDLAAYATIYSLLSNAFLLAEAEPYPLGGLCALPLPGGASNLTRVLADVAAHKLPGTVITIKLANMSIEGPPRAELPTRGAGGTGTGALLIAAAALALVVVAALLVWARKKRGRA